MSICGIKGCGHVPDFAGDGDHNGFVCDTHRQEFYSCKKRFTGREGISGIAQFITWRNSQPELAELTETQKANIRGVVRMLLAAEFAPKGMNLSIAQRNWNHIAEHGSLAEVSFLNEEVIRQRGQKYGRS